MAYPTKGKDDANSDAMRIALEKESESNKIKYLGLALSDSQKQECVERILADVENDQGARKEFLDKIVEIMEMYEGKITGTNRYEGEFHTSSRIVTMSVETLHSILFPAVWNEDLQYWSPVGKEDIPTAEVVDTFMEWDSRYTKMVRFVDNWVKRLILEGTVITKTRWVEEFTWSQVKTLKPNSLVKKVKRVIQDLLSRRKVELDFEQKDFNITYEPKKIEYCDVDIIPLEDVGFPVFNDNNVSVDKLDHIWHRSRPFLYQLQEQELRGLIEPQVCDRICDGIRDTILAAEGTTKQRMDSEGSRLLNNRVHLTPASVIEWYGKYQVNGRYEDVVIWIEEKSKSFLAATYLRKLNQFNKRPFNIANLIPRPGRLYGMGAGELVREFQRVMDEMMSINLNAAKMGVYPPGFYRAASGFDPEKITVQPGIMIPVDDINDAKWVQIPNNILPTSQEMRFILELVQQISGVGAYQTGQESNITKTRSTARGTLALISQGERRFTVLGKRLQYHLCEIMKSKLEYYQQFLPPGFAERILGADNAELFPDGLEMSDLAGEFDLWMSLDSTGGSKSLKVENASQMYAGYMNNPLVQEDKARVWEVSAKPLTEAGIIDVERYLGPKPPTIEEQAQQAGMTPDQYKQAMMMQQQALQAGAAPGASSPQGQSSPAPTGAPAPPVEVSAQEAAQVG